MANKFTVAPGSGMGRATGSASTSPRMIVIRISPGAVAVMVIRSAVHAAANASAWRCQWLID
ncbi:Uncharacterised protein [Mycobacteroides abscessus subsp. abscessus]|nr:Uncharacterised protein [Mycobacteroides abscessus subsp. abscessus]